MQNIDETIQRLRAIVFDDNCKNMNLSNIKGYLGELLVTQKLIQEGLMIIPKGNQSGYDIEVPEKKIKIDVKFSTIKKEVTNGSNYWGWALKHKNKFKDISCSHFICVAVDKKLEPLHYYIIRSTYLNNFPTSAIRQFKNVERGFVLLENHKQISNMEDGDLKNYFLSCKKLLDNKTITKISATNKLNNYLN